MNVIVNGYYCDQISHLDELPDITDADPATEADLNNGAIRIVEYIFSFLPLKLRLKMLIFFPTTKRKKVVKKKSRKQKQKLCLSAQTCFLLILIQMEEMAKSSQQECNQRKFQVRLKYHF